jgi:hypothetical protein
MSIKSFRNWWLKGAEIWTNWSVWPHLYTLTGT